MFLTAYTGYILKDAIGVRDSTTTNFYYFAYSNNYI